MSDFASFKSSLKGDLVTSSDDVYAASLARWTVTSERKALAVAFVKDEADVALTLAYAKQNNLKIAIRSGGHSLSASSSIEGGIVIDLSRHINTVRVDQDTSLGYVGGGATWEQVDKETMKYGLAAVAGTINTTGVGGLTLGGGYGWQTSAHGLALDNLVQATIVTANGETVIASASSHPDLFWAIRGGGSNFGVVTEFVFQLHAQRPTVYFGVLIYTPAQTEQVVAATKAWWETAGEKESMLQLAGVSPEGQDVLIIAPFYNGSEAEGRANFKAFLDIGPVGDKTGEIPYEAVNGALNMFAPPGGGIYAKGVERTVPDYPTFWAAFQRAIEISRDPACHGIQSRMIIDFHPTCKVDTVPRDATAFRRPPPKTYNIGLHFGWPGDKDKETHNGRTKVEIARELSRDVGNLVTGGKMASAYGYTNFDADASLCQPQEAPDARAKIAFGDNYPRLQRVKKEYDPENVFSNWFRILPA